MTLCVYAKALRYKRINSQNSASDSKTGYQPWGYQPVLIVLVFIWALSALQPCFILLETVPAPL
ncbi:MAG: hypothetical protein ACI81A_001070 [Paraglaciecola sp.]|jgi:hypothetical protein